MKKFLIFLALMFLHSCKVPSTESEIAGRKQNDNETENCFLVKGDGNEVKYTRHFINQDMCDALASSCSEGGDLQDDPEECDPEKELCEDVEECDPEIDECDAETFKLTDEDNTPSCEFRWGLRSDDNQRGPGRRGRRR